MIDFVRDHLDAIRLRVLQHKPLDGRAAENAGTGSGVEQPNLAPADPGATGHEVGGRHRREKKTVVFAVPIGALRYVPLAHAISVGNRALRLVGNRHPRTVDRVPQACLEHVRTVPRGVLAVIRGWLL